MSLIVRTPVRSSSLAPAPRVPRSHRPLCTGLRSGLRPLAALLAFGAVAAQADTTLPAPVSITHNGSANALSATTTGTGRAIQGVINNAANGMAAIKGQSNGKGVGVQGVNSGTTAPAARFDLTNTGSAQTAVLVNGQNGGGLSVTNFGYGDVIRAVTQYRRIEGVDTPVTAAVHAENTLYGHYGPVGDGVSATGSRFGVYATGLAAGLYGDGTGGAGSGVQAAASSGYGVESRTDTGTAIYGYSQSGKAAELHGAVVVQGNVTATRYLLSSDRDLKEDVAAVDGAGLLDRIAALPVSQWAYKAEPGVRHVGPMAQDFRAAFGLGDDDRRIDVVDAAGVSLAGVQALTQQLRERETQLSRLQARFDALEARLDAADRGTR